MQIKIQFTVCTKVKSKEMTCFSLLTEVILYKLTKNSFPTIRLGSISFSNYKTEKKFIKMQPISFIYQNNLESASL